MAGADDLAPAGNGSAWPHVVDVEGVPMSALLAEAPEPRAVIVALHGEARPQGAGVFVLGHSMGCVLALQMAGDERGADLLGLEIAGIGRHHHPRAAAVLEARMLDPLWRAGAGREGSVTSMRDVIWGPDHLYPAGATADIHSPVPGYEGDEVRRWPRDLPALAARVRIPVHYSLADHERVWRPGPAALADIAGLFTASPRVVTEEQAGAGHNLSLGLAAMAYHLKVLSFAEECVLARENADWVSGDEQAGAAAPIELAGG
jgi:hypothetical protein